MAPKENPARRGPSGVCPRLKGRRAQAAEASPQYVARYFVPADSTLFRRHLDKPHVACCRLHRALPAIPDWLKFKNPEAPAAKRETEEDWS
jgi:hypothetical protein